jgi:predicted secreted Zn-dependent protease
MLRTSVSAALLLGLVCSTPAWADSCAVVPTFRYYAVTGTSEEELKRSLLEKGPRDDTGTARFAYTDWKVTWKWKRLDDGSVDPESVELACVADILLPELDASATFSPELRRAWDGFIERTRRHELNHVSHVEQRAPEIYKRLRAAAEQSGSVSGKRAAAIVSEVVADIKAMDRHYDAETDHGRTEGAWQIQPTFAGAASVKSGILPY